MNQSSSLSFDDSAIWDTKVRLCLFIPEDQLNILNTLPEWNRVQNNDTTIRIEKDSLIENSQPPNSISVSQNSEKIRKQNIELFDKHYQYRRSILTTCKLYKAKFTRSISLLDISKADKSVSNSNIFLKRASSLPSLCHLLKFSPIKYTKEPSSNNCSPKKHSLLHNSKELFDFPEVYHKNKISILELKQSKDSFCNREISNSEAMEVVSQSPVSIPTNIGKVNGNDTDFSAIAEKVNLLPQHHDESVCNDESVSSPQGLVKNNPSLLSEVKKSTESHVLIACENNISDSTNIKKIVLVSDENAESSQLHQNERKCDDNKGADNDISSKENVSINLNTQKPNELLVSTSCKTNQLNCVEEKMSIDANPVVVKSCDTNLDVQSLNEIPKECVKPVEVMTKEQSCKENAHFNSKNVHENCNKLNDEQMNVSENDQKVHNDTDNSGKLETPVIGKRKSDSKTRRSKKLKSEERQDRVKVKSIKKVGEICYCAEDVKDMLDIIKLLL